MDKVPSFNLDHDKVRAPYVRLCDRIETLHGDLITKFDIRFTQPNVAYLDSAAMHTIEHIVAELSRDYWPGEVVDFSPMGCKTGFYLTLLGEHSTMGVAAKMEAILKRLASWDQPIPGATRRTCGNWQFHDLEKAKAAARAWVEGIEKKGYDPFIA